MAALALGMFDELAALGLHGGDPRERELLWAACMLHDIGMSIDYDDHHKHSRYLILNGGLPGFTPVETAIIAQAARYHRKGMPAPGPMAALFGPGDAERLDRCATLLRLAEDLERSRDQLVQRALLEESDGAVELRLVADGDSAIVPGWAARREGDLFAACVPPRAAGRRLSRPGRAGRRLSRPLRASSRTGRGPVGGELAGPSGAVEQRDAAGVAGGAVPLARFQLVADVEHGHRGAVASPLRVGAAEEHPAGFAASRPGQPGWRR